MFEVTLPLHGKSGKAFSGGPSSAVAEEFADFLAEVSAEVADTAAVLRKLAADGWRADVGRGYVTLTHPKVDTEAEARLRLMSLGLDAGMVEVAAYEYGSEDDDEADAE